MRIHHARHDGISRKIDHRRTGWYGNPGTDGLDVTALDDDYLVRLDLPCFRIDKTPGADRGYLRVRADACKRQTNCDDK